MRTTVGKRSIKVPAAKKSFDRSGCGGGGVDAGDASALKNSSISKTNLLLLSLFLCGGLSEKTAEKEENDWF